MIKIRIHLDGNEQGYLTYTCKESMEEYMELLSEPLTLIGLTEKDTEALITIPIKKYVIEVWSIDE